MAGIAVVIHLAGLIALVLKLEPEGDEHGGRTSPHLDQVVSVTRAEGRRKEAKSEESTVCVPPS